MQSAPPPTTPQATPQQQYPSSPTEAEFIAGFTQQQVEPQQTIDEEDDDIAFHNVSEVEPTDDEPAAEPTTTPSGEQVVEQLQKSMAKASDLVAKTAAAVDASAIENESKNEPTWGSRYIDLKLSARPFRHGMTRNGPIPGWGEAKRCMAIFTNNGRRG